MGPQPSSLRLMTYGCQAFQSPGSHLCRLPSLLIHLHRWKPPVASLSSSGSQSLRAGLSTGLSPIHLVELTGVLP